MSKLAMQGLPAGLSGRSMGLTPQNQPFLLPSLFHSTLAICEPIRCRLAKGEQALPGN
jgi:hypothetical protein